MAPAARILSPPNDLTPTSTLQERTMASEAELHEKAAEGIEKAQAAPPFVEGGVRGWLAVAGAFLTLTCTFGLSNAFGVLQNYYSTVKYPEQPPSNISWIGSLQNFFLFALGILVGPLYDRGYFRPMVTVGSICYLFSLYMVSLCTEFWQTVLAQGVATGISAGFMFLPAISLISQYFRRRRSLAMGIAVVGSSAGGVAFPIALNNLLAKMPFDQAFRIIAYICTGLLVVANLCMTTRIKRSSSIMMGPRPDPRDYFKERRYLFTVVGAFFVALGIFFPFFYLQDFADSKGVSKKVGFYSLAILNAASIFGRTIPNALADQFGPFNVLIPMCAASSILIFAMFGAGSSGGVIAFSIIYGFTSGAYVSVINPVLASLANHVSEIGARIGYAFLTVAFGVLAGGPISGALLVRTPSFAAPIVFSASVVAIGSVFMALARREQVKIKGSQRV